MDLNKKASEHINYVAAMEALPQMLEFLKKMYDESVRIGFSEDQAMEIVSNFQMATLRPEK